MKFTLVLLFTLLFSQVLSAKSSSYRFDVRLSPSIFVLGGNLDFNVRIGLNWSVGPSLFGFNGCGLSTSPDTVTGDKCKIVEAYGIRVNYFPFDEAFKSGPYVGLGFYGVKKEIKYYDQGEWRPGDFKSEAPLLVLGYKHTFKFGLNISAGVGGFYFIDRPDSLTVGRTVKFVIDSGQDFQFYPELNIGWAF